MGNLNIMVILYIYGIYKKSIDTMIHLKKNIGNTIL